MNSKVAACRALILGVGVLVSICCGLTATKLSAQSAVVVKVDTNSPGHAIPDDFNGASFETVNLKSGSSGVSGYLFDSSNVQLVTLFKQLGIKSLRIGGSTVDGNQNFTPANKDIDALFRFARAAGVKVIYSLRLLNGDASSDAATAKYIWENYRQQLDCFCIGNEPQLYHGKDPQITDFATYLVKWRKIASAIADAAPGAKFGGPDSGPGGAKAWAARFASDEAASQIVKCIYYHYYVGGGSKNLSIPQIVDNVLSANWPGKNYAATYRSACAILPLGYSYRFTEANSYYTGGATIGIRGGNDCYATALFALDFMHWWASHDCSGVYFHTTMHPTNWWKYNGMVYLDEAGKFEVRAMGYGVKAFDVGGHGNVLPVALGNSNQLNLTAYAVADRTNVYVTIVNKEHDAGARAAAVTIIPAGASAGSAAAAMFLEAPKPTATSGITLGGASITNDAPWRGKWTPLTPAADGQCSLTVPPASAAIVKIDVNHQALKTN